MAFILCSTTFSTSFDDANLRFHTKKEPHKYMQNFQKEIPFLRATSGFAILRYFSSSILVINLILIWDIELLPRPAV